MLYSSEGNPRVEDQTLRRIARRARQNRYRDGRDCERAHRSHRHKLKLQDGRGRTAPSRQ